MFPLTAALLASLVFVSSAQLDDYECKGEGRFGHPTDPSSYILCLRDASGALVPVTYSCTVGTFSEVEMTCTEGDEWTFSSRQGRALVSDPSYQYVCSEKNGFFCADCKTMVSCVDGVAYPHPCSDDSTCAMLDIFGGGVCYPGQPEGCSCTQANSFRIDNYDSKKFFYCNDSGAAPQMYQCPEEMIFDETTILCVNEEKLPECERSGMFAIASNCSQYYTCIASKDGWIQKALSCETPDFMYNEASGKCEDPCSWNDGEFSCEAEGRFPDPRDCQRFFECIAVGEGYRVFSRECPAGFQWESDGQGVGKCTKAAGDSSCKAFSPNKCFIPENMCSAAGGSLPSEIPPTATREVLSQEQPFRRTGRRGDRRT